MFRIGYKCRRIRQLLSDRIDGPLAPAEECRVQKHLTHCPECREELAFYRQIRETAESIEEVTPPDYLWDRISVEIDIDPWGGQKPTLLQKLWKWVAVFSPTGKINFAGIVLSCMLISVLCLLPGGGNGNSNQPDNALAQAEEIDAHLEYLSLYMTAKGDQFPSTVRNYYLGQIEGLDQKIRMIKSALNRFPENKRVRAQLAVAYQHKLALYHRMGLTDVDRLPIQAGGRSIYERGDFYE
ncbi:MAG: hypothetical protein GY841_05445 [FCB group bacterium]|nr:hypothetical protein [FCB group bacterium]